MSCSRSDYVGEIRHKGVHHPGLHEPIVDLELWDKTPQLLLRSRAVRRAQRTTKSVASPLTRKLFDEGGLSLAPSHAVKGERRYRYYMSCSLIRGTAASTGRAWRLPAPGRPPCAPLRRDGTQARGVREYDT